MALRSLIQWLPTELELFRAVADRSALAIDRARMTDALREREMRIVELSGHLLKAQEEERKRISRELHDETGQALMVIRLYLGMLDGTEARRPRKKSANCWPWWTAPSKESGASSGAFRRWCCRNWGMISAIRKRPRNSHKTAGEQRRVAISDNFGSSIR